MYGEIRKHAKAPLRSGSLWALVIVALVLAGMCWL
jgi:hypothetical protein